MTWRMMAICSSRRLPRVFISWPSHWNSSGIQLSPTPRPMRPGNMAAIELTDLATSSGSRSEVLSTFV